MASLRVGFEFKHPPLRWLLVSVRHTLHDLWLCVQAGLFRCVMCHPVGNQMSLPRA